MSTLPSSLFEAEAAYIDSKIEQEKKYIHLLTKIDDEDIISSPWYGNVIENMDQFLHSIIFCMNRLVADKAPQFVARLPKIRQASYQPPPVQNASSYQHSTGTEKAPQFVSRRPEIRQASYQPPPAQSTANYQPSVIGTEKAPQFVSRRPEIRQPSCHSPAQSKPSSQLPQKASGSATVNRLREMFGSQNKAGIEVSRYAQASTQEFRYSSDDVSVY